MSAGDGRGGDGVGGGTRPARWTRRGSDHLKPWEAEQSRRDTVSPGKAGPGALLVRRPRGPGLRTLETPARQRGRPGRLPGTKRVLTLRLRLKAHTHIHTSTHAHAHSRTHACTHTTHDTHARTNACTHAHRRLHARTCTHTHMHTLTHATRTHAHTRCSEVRPSGRSARSPACGGPRARTAAKTRQPRGRHDAASQQRLHFSQTQLECGRHGHRADGPHRPARRLPCGPGAAAAAVKRVRARQKGRDAPPGAARSRGQARSLRTARPGPAPRPRAASCGGVPPPAFCAEPKRFVKYLECVIESLMPISKLLMKKSGALIAYGSG